MSLEMYFEDIYDEDFKRYKHSSLKVISIKEFEEKLHDYNSPEYKIWHINILGNKLSANLRGGWYVSKI